MSIGIQKTFNLDMVPGGAPPIIHVSAGDVGRPFRANLLYNGDGYDLEDVTSVKIRGTKPDNTVFEYALTYDDEDSHVDFNIEEQMAIIAGQVLCEIRLFSGEDTIGSANFVLDVETAVYDPEAASESYIPTYETAIQEALETVADDIADLATAAAINDVKQYSDAASASATAAAGSATSAAESAAAAFSGTPEGYSTLVSTVNELNNNAKDSAVKMFPREELASNTDLNNVLIGDYCCSSYSIKDSLSNLPSGVGVVFRLQVFSITRDGIAAPTESVPWIRRLQIIIDSNGQIFLRFGSRGNATTSMAWGAWKKASAYAPPSYGFLTPSSGWSADNANYYETADAWCHICSRLITSSAATVSNGYVFATGLPNPRTKVYFNAVTSHDQLVQCVIDTNGNLKSYWPSTNGTSLDENTIVDFDVTYRLA